MAPNGAWIPAQNTLENPELTFDVRAKTWNANIEFDHLISSLYSLRVKEYQSKAVK
jgi:hypothetical protein